jgi:cell division protein FtsI/penicillin-binding protein 2
VGNVNSGARIGVIGLVFLALLGVLTLRLWTMQVTEVQAYEDRADRNQVRVVFTPAPRGDIYDSNGVKLAGTRSALAAVVDLALVETSELETLARNLAAFLDVPTSELLDHLENPSAGAQVTVATDLTEYEATFLAEHRETFPGVNIVPQPVRVYPEGDLAAHIIGYIGRPNETDLERENVKGTTFVGKAGVERFYDDQLLGTEGLVQYQVDAKRKVLALAGEEVPTAGSSLVLTIDSELQRQLEDSLRDGLIEARNLEMQQRVSELAEESIPDRLATALRNAQEAAREEAAEDSAATSDPSGTAPSEDDDDVAPDEEVVTINPASVLASLYPGLPIDAAGVCVPVQRVTVPLDGDGVLSGTEPRFARLDAVAEVDGDLVATVSVAGERYTVKDNESFAGTVQVLHIQEEEIILYHRDRWCPVRSVGVVMDPTDGSVLAMASYPTFDPSAFVDGLSDSQWASLSTVSAFQNFAVQGLYAPASAFKTVPYILAMEESYYPSYQGPGGRNVDESGNKPPADPLTGHTDEYLCSGEFEFADGQTKNDWKWRSGGHGLLDLHGALVESCDLYFWDLALSLWEERNDDPGVDKENLLQEYARMFGYGTATGIDLPFERDGLIPDRAWFLAEQRENTGRVRADGGWLGGDLMDIAVGQGAVLTTPLQMASGYSAMVNGGTLWQPRVVSEIVNSDGEVIQENPPSVVREIDLSPATVQWLRNDLRDVVNDLGGQPRAGDKDYYGGTAKDAFRAWRQDEDFGHNVALVGGKTGTGEVIKDSRGNEPFREVDNAWFMGVAPINNPRYVISIVVERGGSGGKIAAPIAVQILQYLLNGPDDVFDLAEGRDSD